MKCRGNGGVPRGENVRNATRSPSGQRDQRDRTCDPDRPARAAQGARRIGHPSAAMLAMAMRGGRAATANSSPRLLCTSAANARCAAARFSCVRSCGCRVVMPRPMLGPQLRQLWNRAAPAAVARARWLTSTMFAAAAPEPLSENASSRRSRKHDRQQDQQRHATTATVAANSRPNSVSGNGRRISIARPARRSRSPRHRSS